MKPDAAKRTLPSAKNAAKARPLTLQGRIDKWFLPVVFVLIGVVLVWTFVHAYLAK